MRSNADYSNLWRNVGHGRSDRDWQGRNVFGLNAGSVFQPPSSDPTFSIHSCAPRPPPSLPSLLPSECDALGQPETCAVHVLARRN